MPKAGRGRHSGQAKRDPESSPAEGGIQIILDSGFRRNDGASETCKSLMKKLFGAEDTARQRRGPQMPKMPKVC